MHGTVTISSSFGTGGALVGMAVADELGLKFYDRAIPVAVARELKVDQKEVLALDAKAPGRFERFLAALAGAALPLGIPEMSGETVAPNRFKEATEQVLRQIADGDGGVVLGRAAMVVLRGRPNVLSVRLTGPEEARLQQAISREFVEAATAREEQKATDAAREAYSQAFYGVRQDDARQYHLVMDATEISLESMARIIVIAARERFSA